VPARDARVSSDKQVAANWRNGAKSRGPLTAKGTAVASRNAFRHGLSAPLSRSIGPAAERIAEFAHQLVGGDASQSERDLATKRTKFDTGAGEPNFLFATGGSPALQRSDAASSTEIC